MSLIAASPVRFLPVVAGAAAAVAGFAAVAVVADVSFFATLAGAAIGSSFFCDAGELASAGAASCVVSTVADAFSSVAGAVDSVGAGDSSCPNVIAATNRDAKNGIMIFM